MAIIQVTQNGAEVQAQGTAKSATVNFSGALMEMLATTYTQILLAAIREAIQNACDASRRAGLSFEEGVLVTLPTKENPVFRVMDKGSGMTAEFMDTTYLSFGSSTKSGDNGAAGGLGVGRWAAYGYIRECVIATCHASDMQERTYFQFQSEDGIPQVQLASTVQGEAVGTKVSFPVKDTDIEETAHIVAWLKEIMQLTMKDSFSVENPSFLPSGGILEYVSGTVLELGDFNPALAGIRVFPMTTSDLLHERGDLRENASLLVLTNQEAGIGGLPFKVSRKSELHTIFSAGMIVEVPMSFNVPFMPSREEIKYTDEVVALLAQIDGAAHGAVVARVKELYEREDLESKKLLNALLGEEGYAWHYFSKSARNHLSPLHKLLKVVTGGKEWRGKLDISVPIAVDQIAGVQFSAPAKLGSLSGLKIALDRKLHFQHQSKSRFGRSNRVDFMFSPSFPLTIVFNDLETGGTKRTRAFLERKAGAIQAGEKFLFVNTKKASDAKIVADLLNNTFAQGLSLIATSSLPEVCVPRKVVGTDIVKSEGIRITYYNVWEYKQEAKSVDFSEFDSAEPIRYWISKDGAKVEGFTAPFSDLTGNWRCPGHLHDFLRVGLNIKQLYLLTPRQSDKLREQLEAARVEGLFDMEESDFGSDAEGQTLLQRAKALKSWVSLEDGMRQVVQSRAVQSAMVGKYPFEVMQSADLSTLCKLLGEEPRLEMKGTKFDTAISPFMDVVSGEVNILNDYKVSVDQKHVRLCHSLANLCSFMSECEDSSEERQALIADLKKLDDSGRVDYRKHWKELCDQFPILGVIGMREASGSEQGVKALCSALAMLYR